MKNKTKKVGRLLWIKGDERAESRCEMWLDHEWKQKYKIWEDTRTLNVC